VTEERRRSPFSAHIGAVMEELREGYARLSLVVEERHTNPIGFMHGGVITTMMDSSLGAALMALRGEEAKRNPHATIDMNVSLLSSARPGDRIVVEGSVLRLGKSIAFGEAEARRTSSGGGRDGELIAKGRLTFAVRQDGREGRP
jgi:acyl-CoA thioesterase